MRRWTEENYDDLQAVLRTLHEDTDLSMVQIADNVAKRIERTAIDDDIISPAMAKVRAMDARKAVDNFLKSPQNKGLAGFVKACLQEIIDIATLKQPPDYEEYIRFAEAFAQTEDYRRQDRLFDFIQECRKNLSTGRPKIQAISDHNSDDTATKHISRVHLLAAREFENHDTDVDPMDSRIGDSRYVCIRMSSKIDNEYVVHGLRFSPYIDDPEAYFFSSRYVMETETGEAFGMSANGVCCLEGSHLSAFARAPHSQGSMTYLHAKLPFMTNIDDGPSHNSFEAVISTINSKGERFWAKSLCFRCTSKKDKHKKVGIYSFDNLLKIFNAEEQQHLIEWHDQDKWSLMRL